MNDLWKFIKGLCICLYFSPLVIGLLIIATGNGTSSRSSNTGISSGSTWGKQLEKYESERQKRLVQEELQKQTQNALQNYNAYKYTSPVQLRESTGPTPDDAESEGYDEGYEQGRNDGLDGHYHGYGYDDSSDYYDYYEERYSDGYEEGYDEGYNGGNSEYEDEQNQN